MCGTIKQYTGPDQEPNLMKRVHVRGEIQHPLIVVRSMIQKESIMGAEVHSEANFPPTSIRIPICVLNIAHSDYVFGRS